MKLYPDTDKCTITNEAHSFWPFHITWSDRWLSKEAFECEIAEMVGHHEQRLACKQTNCPTYLPPLKSHFSDDPGLAGFSVTIKMALT